MTVLIDSNSDLSFSLYLSDRKNKETKEKGSLNRLLYLVS